MKIIKVPNERTGKKRMERENRVAMNENRKMLSKQTHTHARKKNRLCTEIKTQQCAIIIIVKRGAYRTRQIATLESLDQAKSQKAKGRRLKVAVATATATLADATTATSRATTAEVGGQASVYNDLWANGPTRTLAHTIGLTHTHTRTPTPTPHKTKMAHIRDPRRSEVCYAWPFQAMLANRKRPKSQRATSQLAKKRKKAGETQKK